ncbi:3'-5' exonuclease [Bdellovibrionota bacterium FG-1]
MSQFLAIDFETANYSNDSACAIGLVRVEQNQIIQKEVHLIRPPQRQFMFTHIHGITWSDVANAPTFGELWPKISSLFEGLDFIAAHNAGFDKRVLSGCCSRYGIPLPKSEFTCTVQLARKAWNIRPTTLSHVCTHLGIPLNHHEALSDALACAKIVLASNLERP